MKELRFKALVDAQAKKPVTVDAPGRVLADYYYGQNVFSRRQPLPKYREMLFSH